MPILILLSLLLAAGPTASAAETFATFDQAREGLFARIRQDYGTELGLYSLTVTRVGPDGSLGPDSVLTATGNVLFPVGGDLFHVTDVGYIYTRDQGFQRTVTEHDSPGGAWLVTPTFSAAVGIKMSVPGLTRLLRGKHRRFDGYASVTLTYTDSADDRLRWVAEYTRRRFFLRDYAETSNTQDWDGVTFFRRD